MSGQHEEVQKLYEELGPALLAYARSIVRDPAEAEDAVQQVFLKLMSAQATMPREPRPYMFRAVRNTCLNRRRGQEREVGPQEVPPRFAAPDGLDGLACDLEDALQQLPQDQCEVVVLRVWGEMTLEETARVLGIPVN